jgi:hypothetical protein
MKIRSLTFELFRAYRRTKGWSELSRLYAGLRTLLRTLDKCVYFFPRHSVCTKHCAEAGVHYCGTPDLVTFHFSFLFCFDQLIKGLLTDVQELI